MDHRRLHARVRRPAAHHRQPVATASAARVRCRSASCCSASARPRRRSPTRPTQLIVTRAFMGIGGALIMPVDAVDPHQRVPRPARARPGDRHLGRLLRPRRRHRPDDRWPAARRTSRGARCSGSTSRSASRRSCSAPSSSRRRRDPSAAQARPARRRPVDRRARLAAVRHHRGPVDGLERPVVVAAFVVGRHRPRRRSSRWELHTADADARHDVLQEPPLHRREQRDHARRSSRMFGSMFLMTQYWQLVHGYTPLEAGVRLLPYAIDDDDRRTAVGPGRRARRHQARRHDRAARPGRARLVRAVVHPRRRRRTRGSIVVLRRSWRWAWA